MRALFPFPKHTGNKKARLSLSTRRAFLESGAGEENRTPDLRITNALLYQLSYSGFHFVSLIDSDQRRGIMHLLTR